MKGITSILLLLLTLNVSAQVTFTKDIAPIIYNQCTSCHRPGEIGPFALQSYEDVRDRGQMIAYVTSERYMPPWQPDPSYSHFIDENYLTDESISKIKEWVDNGMPYGNASEEPALPEFPEESLLGEPDMVLEFEETHIHKGNGKDEYRYFVLPTGLTENRVLKAIEMRPGNRQIVHHALFFQDTTSKAASYDAQTPEYGFEGFGDFGTDAVLTYDNYPGYVPGTKPLYYPEGMGQKLNAGSDLVVQVHYAPWPTDEEDKSKINLFFAKEDEPIKRLVDDDVMLPFHLEGGAFSFYLPAQTKKTFHGKIKFYQDRSLIGLSPHMHYLGTEWEIWLETPEGDRVNLCYIPEWDFNWQGYYYFPELIVAKEGSTLHAVAKYDNTSDNPANPSNPPKFVTWGEGTEDEMYFLPVLSVPYQEGDEDVVFTNTDDMDIDFPESEITSISPNPILHGQAKLDFSLAKGQAIDIRIMDTQGRLIRMLRQGEYFGLGKHSIYFSMDEKPSGIYFMNIVGRGVNISQSFAIKK